MNHSSNFASAANKRTSSDECSSVAQVYHQLEDAVEERPLSSLILSFGVGLGVGLALGGLLAASDARGERQQRTAERFGRQLLDALGRIVPHALTERIAR